jgi:aspartyl-tRNA synthetase
VQPVKEQQSFDNFGVRPLIRSEERTHKVYTNVGELSAAKDGETVFVRARLYTVRGTGAFTSSSTTTSSSSHCPFSGLTRLRCVGNKLAFVVLRQRTATVQAVLEKNETVSVEMIKFTKGIHRESLVDVKGVVTKAGTEIASCTQKDVELRVTSLFVVSQTLLQELPLLLEDASRPAPILKAQVPFVSDFRLLPRTRRSLTHACCRTESPNPEDPGRGQRRRGRA